MTGKKLLVVVDDNRRFAVHVWRQLTLAMEFGFTERSKDTFRRISPDGRLEVLWHDPRRATVRDYERALSQFQGERWTIIDVRGVPSTNNRALGWREYYEEFLRIVDDVDTSKRIWVMSSYGPRGWGTEPRVLPKTVETLRALQREMRLVNDFPKPTRDPDQSNDVSVLVSGAGFEFREPLQVGISIGCPTTAHLLCSMKPFGTRLRDEPSSEFPVPYANAALIEAAERQRLDDYWDALLTHVAANLQAPRTNPARNELLWREAFRRAFMCHDFGHQAQSLAAARLEWDYWLTTNYTRFADRAIDLVDETPASNPWRSITTSIEADALAPFVGSHVDLAEHERVVVKLHGDIGHVWTMAIAGQDKRPDSKLFVRPQLHRMYTVAETMLLGSLWRREAETCTWHVVGHGLQDLLLLRLIAAVVQRSPQTRHRMLLVAPLEAALQNEPEQAARTRRVKQLAQTFEAADEPSLAKLICEFNAKSRRDPPPGCLSVRPVFSSALEYMSQLGANRLERVHDNLSAFVASMPPPAFPGPH
jgi:hypothetical protein